MIKAINSKLSFPVLASPWPLPEGVKVTSPGPTSSIAPLSLYRPEPVRI